MNYKHKLAQPVSFWNDNKHSKIRPNIFKMPVLLEEVEAEAAEVVPVLELTSWGPFKQLVKSIDYETSHFTVLGYYLVGTFTLDDLKVAIEEGSMRKSYQHVAFSDKPLPSNWETVAVSYDDTRILIDCNGTLEFVERDDI